jgi:hypothetical protein
MKVLAIIVKWGKCRVLTYNERDMKKFLIILIGFIGAYLMSVGIFNAWNFLSELEPVEVVKRLSVFVYGFFSCTFIIWFIMVGLFDMY